MFGRKMTVGVMCMDEVHLIRTANMLRLGIAELVRKSQFSIGATATPIVTSPLVSSASGVAAAL